MRNRSQITLTYTDDGPVTPSLSNGFVRTNLAVPGGIRMGESDSCNLSNMFPPSSFGRGSP